MKMLRKISVLALVLVLVCMFSASAFAATYTNSIKNSGITMYLYANVEEKWVSADVSLSTGDAIGNYLSIDVWSDYYVDESLDDRYLVYTDGDAFTSATDTWDCYLTHSPEGVVQMHFAEVDFYGEHYSSYYGALYFNPTPAPVYYQ